MVGPGKGRSWHINSELRPLVIRGHEQRKRLENTDFHYFNLIIRMLFKTNEFYLEKRFFKSHLLS